MDDERRGGGRGSGWDRQDTERGFLSVARGDGRWTKVLKTPFQLMKNSSQFFETFALWMTPTRTGEGGVAELALQAALWSGRDIFWHWQLFAIERYQSGLWI